MAAGARRRVDLSADDMETSSIVEERVRVGPPRVAVEPIRSRRVQKEEARTGRGGGAALRRRTARQPRGATAPNRFGEASIGTSGQQSLRHRVLAVPRRLSAI